MKGIEFLKKIGHIEEEMVSEAANPIKKSRKWNGNMIKFAGLAACIAVFVGAICVGRAGFYLKKNRGPASSIESESGENAPDTSEISWIVENNAENQEARTENQNEVVSKRMLMLEGKIYVDAGESDIEGRCGMMDGSIDSSVENGEYPEKDNQSNFGSGYGYQYVAEGSIDVNIDGQWIRFETLDSEEQKSPVEDEEPYDIIPSGTEPLDAKEPDIKASDIEETTSIKEPDTQRVNVKEPETVDSDTVPIETVKPGRFEISLNTNTVTAKGAEFIIINIGYENAATGMDFRIEKLVNGNWMECDYISEAVWKDIALILESEKERVFYADWSNIYGSLEKGTYRFRKSVYGDGEGQELYCEFTL